MKSWLVLVFVILLVVGLALSGCAPPPPREGTSGAGATAGMCSSCGGTNFDTRRESERSLETGEEVEYDIYTCRGCGQTTRAPAGIG